MENSNARDLLKRYSEGKCSLEEEALVETYYNQFKIANNEGLTDKELKNNLDVIWADLHPRCKKTRTKLWQGLAAAVVALIFLSGSLFFYLQHSSVNKSSLDK